MGRPHRPSPCCKARSEVQRLFLDSERIILRCTKCGQLRLEMLAKATQPRLRLVERSKP